MTPALSAFHIWPLSRSIPILSSPSPLPPPHFSPIPGRTRRHPPCRATQTLVDLFLSIGRQGSLYHHPSIRLIKRPGFSYENLGVESPTRGGTCQHFVTICSHYSSSISCVIIDFYSYIPYVLFLPLTSDPISSSRQPFASSLRRCFLFLFPWALDRVGVRSCRLRKSCASWSARYSIFHSPRDWAALLTCLDMYPTPRPTLSLEIGENKESAEAAPGRWTWPSGAYRRPRRLVVVPSMMFLKMMTDVQGSFLSQVHLRLDRDLEEPHHTVGPPRWDQPPWPTITSPTTR